MKTDAGAEETSLAPGAAGGTSNSPDGKQPRNRLRLAVDVLLWTAALGIVLIAVWPRDSGPSEGLPAAAFDLPVVGTDQRFSFDSTRQRPLLIEAFASWCGACRRSNSTLDTLGEAAREGRLDVVAISVDDQASQALRAKRTWPISVPVLHDESGSFQRAYGVSVLPTYILIGEDGTVKDVSTGPAGALALRRWLRPGD